jgi:hypothetical protein
MVTTVLDAS